MQALRQPGAGLVTSENDIALRGAVVARDLRAEF